MTGEDIGTPINVLEIPGSSYVQKALMQAVRTSQPAVDNSVTKVNRSLVPCLVRGASRNWSVREGDDALRKRRL